MALLIIGGAGYIGSHFLRDANFKQESMVVLDDLSTGRQSRIPNGIPFIKGNAVNLSLLHEVIQDYRIDNVIHLAARRQARESIHNPIEYWTNNVGATLSLVSAIKGSTVKNILFASSCSVYGQAKRVGSDSSIDPVSPYGRTKAVCEQILKESCDQLKIGLGVLRFFNILGADVTFDSADTTKNAIMPNLVEAAVMMKTFEIYGNDFNTKDGTAIRDYLDVRDLVLAHRYVLDYLLENGGDLTVNVSTGVPTSVLEIVRSASNHLSFEPLVRFATGKPGDPSEIFAEKDAHLTNLGWNPRHSLDESVATSIDSYKEYLHTQFIQEPTER